ncbi:MAG: acyl-CoA thioester hydrolase [Francisellaceae bacterium]|jgi:acyl-CoA thioester hydrolase
MDKSIIGKFMIETYRGTVLPVEIDQLGHMNVAYYLTKFSDSCWHLLSQAGVTTKYIRHDKKAMVSVENIIKYKLEALNGDLITIKSYFMEVKDKVIRTMHVMYNSETKIELANCEIIQVFMDLELRKSCLIPENIKQGCIKLLEIDI